jgi:hypothetical protein
VAAAAVTALSLALAVPAARELLRFALPGWADLAAALAAVCVAVALGAVLAAQLQHRMGDDR